jgi:type III secretory pathway component EscT
MSKLMHEPSITNVLQTDFFNARKSASLAIAERIAKEHAIPVSLAARLADMLMGLTARAGEQVQRFGLPFAEATDIVVTMLLGAIEATANKYHRGKISWPNEYGD